MDLNNIIYTTKNPENPSQDIHHKDSILNIPIHTDDIKTLIYEKYDRGHESEFLLLTLRDKTITLPANCELFTIEGIDEKYEKYTQLLIDVFSRADTKWNEGVKIITEL